MNQTTIRPAPINKTITLRCSPEKAFKVFTDGFDKWWPKASKIGATAMVGGVIEPKTGGRWYEIGEDGAQCDWGDVLTWDPPKRLVLAWRVNGAWKYDPAATSEVEVVFTDLGGGQTRVDLEHRGMENLGAAAGTMRDILDGPRGWGAILALFQAVAEA